MPNHPGELGAATLQFLFREYCAERGLVSTDDLESASLREFAGWVQSRPEHVLSQKEAVLSQLGLPSDDPFFDWVLSQFDDLWVARGLLDSVRPLLLAKGRPPVSHKPRAVVVAINLLYDGPAVTQLATALQVGPDEVLREDVLTCIVQDMQGDLAHSMHEIGLDELYQRRGGQSPISG